ncbi:MAG: hypothetical protein P8L44_10120 [Opitutales bacterium]|nr:hypothetical protein [Opitutales bacterium]
MKHISLITLPTLFLLCVGLAAQDVPDAPAVEQKVAQTNPIEEPPPEAVEAIVEELEEAVSEESPQAVEDESEAQAATVTIVEDKKQWEMRKELVSVGSDSPARMRNPRRWLLSWATAMLREWWKERWLRFSEAPSSQVRSGDGHRVGQRRYQRQGKWRSGSDTRLC